MRAFKNLALSSFFLFGYLNSFAQCERCAEALSQMKDDKTFLSFLALNETITNQYVENSKKSPRSVESQAQDSIYMRDTSISIETKFETMNYSGVKYLTELSNQASEIFLELEEKYPVLKEFSDEEYSAFIKIAFEYYNNLKKQ